MPNGKSRYLLLATKNLKKNYGKTNSKRPPFNSSSIPSS